MILHTPNILDTDASIVQSSAMGAHCKITKLAGMSGEPDLWFYNAEHKLTRNPGPREIMERLGLQIYVSQEGMNIMLFNTWHPHAKIAAGDSVTVFFHGGQAWRGVFLTGGLRENNRKRSLIVVQNYELDVFTREYVNYIEILNHRTGRVMHYSLLDYPNAQYKNAQEGEQLLQIMAKRILGAKEMMLRTRVGG
jgi:hypothetical protein